MRNWTAFAIFALSVALFSCGGGNGILPKPPEPPISDGTSTFVISVQSTPPGAEIFLDGRSTGLRSTLIGTDPISLPLPLVEGQTHLLTLRFDGYHDWHQWVERTSEGTVIVKATLQPKSNSEGLLIVTSEPSGAKIILDGTETGKVTPATISVTPSCHAIKVEMDGFLPGYETVFVPSGEQVEVHIPLQPKNTGVISGVVYDRFGGTPSGAFVELKTPQGEVIDRTRSTSFGLFRFRPVPPGNYIVTAEIEVESVREVGQVENVVVKSGERTFVSLVVFPADLVGSVEGVVKEPDGKPIPNAQVAVLYYAADLDFVLTSRRTMTDGQGRFRLENVPAATQVVIARKQGYQATQTQATVRAGERTFVEIVLQPLTDTQALQPPTKVFAISYIVPTEFLPNEGRGTRQRVEGVESGAEFYRQVLASLLRKRGHPASQIFERLTKFKRTPNRFFPEGFVGSVGIGWEPPLSIPSQGLLGYRVYRSVPTATGWKLRLVVDEPEQTTAEDVAFDFTSGQTYRYTVTAIMLDGRETSKSEPVLTTFLSPIRLVEPADNAEVAQSQLQFRWTPVGGSVPFYFVQLYSNPEAMLIGNPVWSTAAIEGTTQAVYDGQPLLKGKTYWWLVIGTDERDWLDAKAFTVSQVRRVVIVGD
ncbi:PEGA domain-containing protein [Fervidibacter sacchari]|uniref:Fibronectin type-III domain-containing protein n=1 Tax=Candidatus Fervidibacter sacchari TaxID=1448929 RepID=A0ABT2EKE3_9BACT|nr:PEGA domain-containing protein [Candidatus Fervidibacter sacchari]MCS3918424.1 hypothetical protein [Candidatus Fervidibacter sacchari]WKU16207.1 PEGA domain-containing protein [Candidatus Fervidibacter sacchari]